MNHVERMRNAFSFRPWSLVDRVIIDQKTTERQEVQATRNKEKTRGKTSRRATLTSSRHLGHPVLVRSTNLDIVSSVLLIKVISMTTRP